MTVAVFDFDGTVSDRDAVAAFCARVAGRGKLAMTFARNAHVGFAAMRDRQHRDRFKAALARAAFAGREIVEVEKIAAEFASEHLKTVRANMRERIKWHRDQGHKIVFASASFDVYMHPIGDALDADVVICTRLESKNGVYTGELDGLNMRATVKADAVKAHVGDAEMWAYGNSSDDYPMMGLAEHAFLVTKQGEIKEWP